MNLTIQVIRERRRYKARRPSTRTLALAKSQISCTIVYMDIVSDTNILLAVIFNEPEKDNIVRLTSGNDAIAPEILPYEVGNALSAMIKRKQITQKEALQAQKSINSIPVRLMSVDIAQALQLAIDFNIYAYDTYFLQCAINHSCPLLTLDKGMKKVAKQLNIKILE